MIAVPLGVAAGVLTTIAGMGGGMLLLLALSAAWGPHRALAVTAPALLVGNLHRLWMYRRDVDWGVARAFVVGAAPGSLLGGLLAVALPARVLYGVMAGLTALAVARVIYGWQWRPGARVLTPAGASVGLLTGSAGGAGILAAPLLMSAGLSGVRYVATAAGCAAAMHVGRLAAYGHGGLMTREVLLTGGLLALAITAGNLLGARLRRGIDATLSRRIEIGALVASVVLVLGGISR